MRATTLQTLEYKWRPLVAALLVCAYILLVGISKSASAQLTGGISEETKASAIIFANYIQENQLIINANQENEQEHYDNLVGSEQLVFLRQRGMEVLTLRKKLDVNDILQGYQDKAILMRSKRDIDIANIYLLYNQIVNLEYSSPEFAAVLKKIAAYQKNDDWFVGNRACILSAFANVRSLSLTQALIDAQAAFALIPQEVSAWAAEAAYETSDVTAYLQVLMNDPDLAVSATWQTIKQGQALGRDIDGIGHISNLIHVFEKWREFETASALSEVLINMSEAAGAEVNAIAYFRYGQSLNNSRQYQKAIPFLRKGLLQDNNPRLDLALQAQLAISLAGLGDVAGAKAAIAVFEDMTGGTTTINTGGFDKRLALARTLLSVAENDAATTYRLMSGRLDQELRATFRLNNKNAMDQLAGLESSNARQEERAEAARIKLAAQAAEIKSKQAKLVYLSIIALCLLALTIAAITIAILRRRAIESMEIAAVAALQGDKAKQRFLSVMSHELRTPLNGIIGIADLLSVQGATKELRDMNTIMLESGQHLLELLTGILDMSQMESGNLSIITAPNNIRFLADNVYQKYVQQVDGETITFTCCVADSVPNDLMIDGIRFKQALDALVSNAVKFTQKGRVHIHITMSEDQELMPPTLSIIVADTGLGIREHLLGDLFRPFMQADSSITRAHDGAGIGLTVTRGLARLMGGDVVVETSAGRGSAFTMTISTQRCENAIIDEDTGQPMFIITPNPEKKVEFAPAVSPEKLKADYEAYAEELRAKEAQEQAERYAQSMHGAGADMGDGISHRPQSQSIPSAALSAGDLVDDILGAKVSDANGMDVVSIDAAPYEPPVTVQKVAKTKRAGFTRRSAREGVRAVGIDALDGLNILIVEDLEVNQEVLRSLLEPVGCSVCCAFEGGDALDVMKTQVFDVVLMDIRMPGMNGVDATAAIRKIPGAHQNVPIIALTADASAENNALCLAAGADVFLTKPVIVSELFASIRFAISKKKRQKDTREAEAQIQSA